MHFSKGLPRYLYDVHVVPWVLAIFGANNQNACFNWFEPVHATRDRGEALSVRQMIDKVRDVPQCGAPDSPPCSYDRSTETQILKVYDASATCGLTSNVWIAWAASSRRAW
jgi:hypothetical protein